MPAQLNGQVYYKGVGATIEETADAAVKLAQHLGHEIGLVYGMVALYVTPNTPPEALAQDLRHLDDAAQRVYAMAMDAHGAEVEQRMAAATTQGAGSSEHTLESGWQDGG